MSDVALNSFSKSVEYLKKDLMEIIDNDLIKPAIKYYFPPMVIIGGHAIPEEWGVPYKAFLDRIAEDPADNTAKLILTDWLEENNQSELAEAWRWIIKMNRVPLKYPSSFAIGIEFGGWGWWKDDTHQIPEDHDNFSNTIRSWIYQYLTDGKSHFMDNFRTYDTNILNCFHDLAQAVVKYNQQQQSTEEKKAQV